MKRIPIILVTGFLGSGKTTFLNWLLAKGENKKISIVLNEFGDIALESKFISKKSEDVIELANGCMCCVAKSDIPRVLSLIVAQSPQTESILIEASGLSDPDPILDALRDEELSAKVTLDIVVCIIDTLSFQDTWGQHRILSAQVAQSDVLVLSKVAQAGESVVRTVQDMLTSIVPTTRILRFDDSLSAEFFFDPSTTSLVASSEDAAHVHELYAHFLFSTEKLIDVQKLTEVLRALPTSIVRVKGAVRTAGGTFLVQMVAGRVEVSSYIEPALAQSTILCIGKDFHKEDIQRQLESATTRAI